MKFQAAIIAYIIVYACNGIQKEDDSDGDIAGMFSVKSLMRIGQEMLEDYIEKESKTNSNKNGSARHDFDGFQSDGPRALEQSLESDGKPIAYIKPMAPSAQKYLQSVFEFHQMIICGMPIPPGHSIRWFRVSTVYYNYGHYKCDENGRFELLNCIYGLETVSVSEVEKKIKAEYNQSVFTFNISGIGFCSQVAHKYLYSGAPNDKEHIWKTEYLMCKENRTDVAYYNHKLVVCYQQKYKLIGCLLDGVFVDIAESSWFRQHGTLEPHKDVCVLYGSQNEWTLSRQLLVGHFNNIDDGMTIEIASNIKKFYDNEICSSEGFSFSTGYRILYKFGLFHCENDQLVLLACIYGNQIVDDLFRDLWDATGDFIYDRNDIRYCEQSAGKYLHNDDKSHEEQTIWRNEDFACERAKYQEHGIFYFNNFKLFVCKRDGEKMFLGCAFDLNVTSVNGAKSYLLSHGINLDPEHRDFCFKYGELTKFIKSSIIVQRGGHWDNGKFHDCSRIQKWPNNKIPYYLEPTEESFAKKIRDVIKTYENNTCLKFEELKFKPRYGGIDYVRIRKGNKCSSDVGKTNQMVQELTYNNELCLMHEFGHLVGLVHEHMRPDRDRWVKIDYNRFLRMGQSELEFGKNYFPCNTYHANVFPFEYDSIMNYMPGIDGYVARIVKYNYKVNREKPTTCDFKKINRFNDCAPEFVDKYKCE